MPDRTQETSQKPQQNPWKASQENFTKILTPNSGHGFQHSFSPKHLPHEELMGVLTNHTGMMTLLNHETGMQQMGKELKQRGKW